MRSKATTSNVAVTSNQLPHITTICSQLQDSVNDFEAVSRICEQIVRLRYRMCIPMLVSILDSSEITVSVCAMSALSELKSKQPTRRLMRIIRETKVDELRHAALNYLGNTGDKRAIQLLCKIVNNRCEAHMTRAYAAGALGYMPNSPRKIEALLRALSDPSALIRLTALNSLGISGESRVVELIKLLLSDDAQVVELPDRETVANAANNALHNLGLSIRSGNPNRLRLDTAH